VVADSTPQSPADTTRRPERARTATAVASDRRVTGSRIAAASLMGALACGIVVAATASPGPGLDPDAMSYLGAAQSIVESGVYRVPTSSWAASDTSSHSRISRPDLTAIALPVAAGVAPVQSARLLVALAAFCTWTAS